MPTLTDVRFDTLRALGFAGSTSDMLLAWLQSAPFGGAATVPTIVYQTLFGVPNIPVYQDRFDDGTTQGWQESAIGGTLANVDSQLELTATDVSSRCSKEYNFDLTVWYEGRVDYAEGTYQGDILMTFNTDPNIGGSTHIIPPLTFDGDGQYKLLTPAPQPAEDFYLGFIQTGSAAGETSYFRDIFIDVVPAMFGVQARTPFTAVSLDLDKLTIINAESTEAQVSFPVDTVSGVTYDFGPLEFVLGGAATGGTAVGSTPLGTDVAPRIAGSGQRQFVGTGGTVYVSIFTNSLTQGDSVQISNFAVRGDLPASTIPDAWKAALLADPASGPESTYHRSDYWFAYLESQGYTGQLNDRELAYWLDLFESTTGQAYNDGYSAGYS